MIPYTLPEGRRGTAEEAGVPGRFGTARLSPSSSDPSTLFFCVYRGESMWPTLKESDVLEVVPYGEFPVRAGDVVYGIPPARAAAVIHRAVGCDAFGVQTRGDHLAKPDAWRLRAGEIKGRVVAAWRRDRRRAVAGGWRGRARARCCHAQRGFARLCRPPLYPIYEWLVRSGVMRRMLPVRLEPRVVTFRSAQGERRRVMMGRRAIGEYDAAFGVWRIDWPFRLFVEPAVLRRPPVEAELLLAAMAADGDPAAAARLRELVPVADLDRLIPLAEVHGVAGLLLHRLLRHAGESLPAGLLRALRRTAVLNAANNMRLSRELVHVLELLDGRGLRAVPVKGPVLAVLAYGDASRRSSCDLDILVHPRDMEGAIQALTQDGYRPHYALTGAARSAHVRAREECVLAHTDRGVQVDLETNLVPRYFAFRLPPAALWQDLGSVPLDGASVSSPALEPLLLLLCAHGTKHLWQQLSGIVDVAGLIREQPKLDLSRALRLAETAGGRRMLLLGLSLASAVAGLDLPADLRVRMDSDRVVGRLRDAALRYLRSGSVALPGRRETAMFHMAARERLRDRARYAMGLLCMPSYSDWTLVRLPEPLFFLYYLIRPLRLIGALVRRAWRRLTCGSAREPAP